MGSRLDRSFGADDPQTGARACARHAEVDGGIDDVRRQPQRVRGFQPPVSGGQGSARILPYWRLLKSGPTAMKLLKRPQERVV
jgi:hypothetical protein